jgi:tight adherence protein C
MLQALFDLILDQQVMLALFSAITVAATIFSLAMPYLAKDELRGRMKTVAIEREKIRARERARITRGAKPASLRNSPKQYMLDLVERFNLRKALSDEGTATKLKMGGFRGESPIIVFLFARFLLPFAFGMVGVIYCFGLNAIDQPTGIKIVIVIACAMVGLYAPNIYINNVIQNRQQSIRRAWPDSLDLMLICVESGMSIEPAFKRVAEEVGSQSIPLAEELTLTTAELSFLQDRRMAYENLANRTGLEGVKSVCMALIQAEKYGTPLGQTLRTLAQENRDMRMAEAEKKAAALPPKLTVPMILFFLPVLFAVIMGPAMIQIVGFM